MSRYSSELGARVVVAAARFLGLSEICSVREWDNLDLSNDPVSTELRGELMRTGWHSDWPWPTAFCEAAWAKAYQGRAELSQVKLMLRRGCLQTWWNAVEADWTSSTPQVGAIGVMRHGDLDKGHLFIVRAVQQDTLYTLETAFDSEKANVCKQTRRLHFSPSSGLYLLGFILPMTESE